MPFGAGPSVAHRGGCDYWRTWFIEECEESHLFGVTQKHLGLIKLSGVGLPAYNIDTRIFLEDAPYFRGSKTSHRICGPYEVYSLDKLPSGAEPIYIVDEKVIVFKAAHPEKGPWLNRSRVRYIEGIRVKFRQIADQYDYFPYRFAIRRTSKYSIRLLEHEGPDCWLC